MVYELLAQKGMCDYYSLAKTPGTNRGKPGRKDAFLFLEDAAIADSLIRYRDDQQTHVTFYLPQIHCSSCLWLLENLNRLDEGITSSKVNFERREADIIFDHHLTSLRKTAELLDSIGYEPHLSFNDLGRKLPRSSREKMYKLGIAGFCFANIMLLSFPEYFGIDSSENNLRVIFRYTNLVLSIPVFFYSATEFYKTAWKSLVHGMLNIDAPIVLAILVTFVRSVYEVVSGTGGGYFDSMTGIVFLMLVGRVLQEATYQRLHFERDYTSYFPIAVTKVSGDKEAILTLPQIQLNDTLLIHNEELIPADGILTRGKALIDYSFVTGESVPVTREMGEIVYAGGKQMGSNIEILVIREVAQSYLTRLWNKEGGAEEKKTENSFVHLLGRYFTWIVMGIALLAAAYWLLQDASKMWNVVTAVLIVACPCALLLSNSFTNGNILRHMARNQLFLRKATVIESMATVDTIVFDKTGTLTTGGYDKLTYEGRELLPEQVKKIGSLAAQSTHPYSKAIASWAGIGRGRNVKAFRELPGYGIEGIVGDDLMALGSAKFIGLDKEGPDEGSKVYLSIEEKVLGSFTFHNQYRKGVAELLQELEKEYTIAVVSGDNALEKNYLQKLLGFPAILLFNQDPADKLAFIKQLQNQGRKVMMLGDGLNDAGALKQADVGVAITENNNRFTPASDAILLAGQLPRLRNFIRLCRANKRIVLWAFTISIIYNLVGIGFAVTGILSPLVAAILMPASSISVLLITFGASNFYSKKLGLS